ncbi:IS3 family transposase [Nocardia sp. NPDC004168]|uniref:IS3 family transposase n=1 Tax=Nocardia sp. NPDC004168 TaxID=3154452 RepID=UPI0033AE7222
MASRGTYGAARVHVELRLGQRIRVGRKRVARLRSQTIYAPNWVCDAVDMTRWRRTAAWADHSPQRSRRSVHQLGVRATHPCRLP